MSTIIASSEDEGNDGKKLKIFLFIIFLLIVGLMAVSAIAGSAHLNEGVRASQRNALAIALAGALGTVTPRCDHRPGAPLVEDEGLALTFDIGGDIIVFVYNTWTSTPTFMDEDIVLLQSDKYEWDPRDPEGTYWEPCSPYDLERALRALDKALAYLGLR